MTKSADVAAVLAVRKAPAAAPAERVSKPKPLTLAQRIDKAQGSVVALRSELGGRVSVLEDAWDEAFADAEKAIPRSAQTFAFIVACAVTGWFVAHLVSAALQ